MKQTIQKVYNKVGVKSDRTKNITKHVLVSFIYKGGSIITSFLLVPLTISFLDTENYGIWLTVSSFIGWFSFFDIGLGNGLRNKFAEAKAKDDLTLAKAYVSSAYYTIASICLLLIIVFFGLNYFIDWTRVFNANAGMQNDLGILMPIIFSFFCLQLVVKLITTIYTADQQHSMQGKITFYSSALSLLSIWLMTHFAKSSLLIFGTIFSALPVLVLIGLNIFAFSNRYKQYSPSLILWKKKHLKDIFGLGMKFFILQFCGIVLYTSDNLIISKLFSPAAVVPYNIVFKYFSIVSMGFSIIIAPYWSTITEATQKNDWEWIKNAMDNLLKLVLLTIVVIILMMIFSNSIFLLWIGTKVTIPTSLTLFIGLFFIINTIISPFTAFLNGTGKIRLQVIQAVISAVINIPLSIYLAINLGMGSKGVILATIICSIPGLILAPLQYYKIINKRAVGIFSS
ncbi:lipopolysaccharide biosynthesis protein [Flavobacterium cellulosilyticum]|uniref:lipopolysaccharide biosynthesis protein n=1 Tax=Flavobacterium cellulosilyticum TaxID=2541731 RepID=UPI001404452E|nr:lipopolysaccharide biosynthesis protein [Flavobacterium cellulosilyticum]